MKTYIIDDEKVILDSLEEILKQFPEIEIIYKTNDPGTVLERFETDHPELVFVDISMPVMNGVELAERMFLINPETKVIFLTAFDQYALDAFRVNAVDYILKPVTTSKITRALEKVQKIKTDAHEETKQPAESSGKLRIIGLRDNKFHIFRPDECKYIKTLSREQIVVTEKGSFRLKNNLTYWEEKLAEYGWMRCHKAFLINPDQIEEIYPMFNSTYNIRIRGEKEEITVSRTYLKQFKQLFNI